MRRYAPFVLFALLVWAAPATAAGMPDGGAVPADVAAAPSDAPAAPADVTPAPQDVDPKPVTEPEKPAAAEPAKADPAPAPEVDKVPETPEEVGQALNALFVAIQGGHWAIVVGVALMLLIWVLRRINILSKLPDKAVPWVAAVLGIVGYIAVGLASGVVWYTALVQGFLAGAAAVNFWELLFKHILKKPVKKSEPAEKPAEDKPDE